MRSLALFIGATVLVTVVEKAASLDVQKLQPYIVMLKKKKPVVALEHRVQARSADSTVPRYTAHIEHRAVFAASPDMPGFKMFSSKEAADEIEKDPDVLFVEKDSEIFIDDY